MTNSEGERGDPLKAGTSIQWIGPLTEQDKADLTALSIGQAKAIVAGDADAYGKLCAEDIQLLLPGKAAISGLERFLEIERSVFAEASFESFDKYPESVEMSGDLAVELGTQEVRVAGAKNDKGYLASRQKYMHVFRRTVDGWRFCRLMSNATA